NARPEPDADSRKTELIKLVMLSSPRKRMGAKLARCPGCGAARNEVERCAADPGPPRTVTIPGLQRTTSLRLCCAAPGTRSKLSPYTPSRGRHPSMRAEPVSRLPTNRLRGDFSFGLTYE